MRESDHEIDAKSLKQKKLPNNMDEEINMIENLPDAMLLHILSFLPAKDALKTSILSKRWRHLWMSVSNLYFEEWRPDKFVMFMNSAERAMMCRDVPRIEKFSLSSHMLNSACINALISNALSFKVQDFSLRLVYVGVPILLPHHLFSCPTLTVLNLEEVTQFPCTACLPNLKKVRLSCCLLPHQQSLLQFFSGCPKLQKLILNRCFWRDANLGFISTPMPEPVDITQLSSTTCLPDLKELELSFCLLPYGQSMVQFFGDCPKLQKLTLKECQWGLAKCLYISTPMLESLVICDATSSSGCKVVISGANIKSFSYHGDLTTTYCLCSSSIVDACIHVSSKGMIEREGREKEVAHRLHKLIMECCNVKHLELSPDTLEALAYAEELDLPVFQRLTRLELKRKSVDLSCRALNRLLQKLPHLDCLDFRMGIFLSKKHKNFALDPLPPCFLTQLKIIKIHTFSLTDEELHAVGILFRVSTVLEKVYISGGRLNQNKISMLARESKFEIISM
ncbi:hypothetical protein POPTR_011G024600v4 [Populus trichocarpa]|uniref:Uncharacterized protein n=2 Tax=Populus trichocarpa TaxID=3694 RepID=A0ACC0S7R2_POPTR|nr:F-box/LRR-repeat protein At4g14096 isoform X1 [Populus trichocarpa]KAI5570298.1 hypothetical protein BDE02_11G019000 [Populus trichocarpa]KAI9385137.1 hypothetical protein POPTR_011G024600v4 [Populus trichocarpa]